MSSNHEEEMRAEYDLRLGEGVRGKYHASYIQGASVKLTVGEGAAFVAVTSSSAPAIGAVTRSEFSRLQVRLAPAHAG